MSPYVPNFAVSGASTDALVVMVSVVPDGAGWGDGLAVAAMGDPTARARPSAAAAATARRGR
ncbi:hypothetical protein [Leifsonia poae]|uniref:hypothetical protein n=1 Tax=Leifsonia poae TaxID=110933 RepID=UPI003D66FBBB